MRVTKVLTIPDGTNYFSKMDIKHPQTLVESTSFDDKLHVSLSFQPGNHRHSQDIQNQMGEQEHLSVSVFVDGEQFNVFAGTIDEAREFFKRFPKR